MECEKTLRRAVTRAVTAETGRTDRPPFTFQEAAQICVDQAELEAPDGTILELEGYTNWDSPPDPLGPLPNWDD